MSHIAYLYLFIAIALEIIAAIATRYSEGFTIFIPTTITLLFAILSYFIFSLSLKSGMNIGIGYAIWSGAGVLLVALLGATFLAEQLTLIQIAGVLLIIVGLIAVQITGKNEPTVIK